MELPSDRRGWLKLIGILAGLFVAYMVVKRLLPDIDPQQVLEDVSESLGAWTYGLVALLAFLETGAFVGLIAPGETFVVLAGAVAGQGETSVVLTIGIVWLSAFLGDTASFLLGHKLGRDFILEHGPKLRITRERFAQVESYFDKHGGKTILIGRFIGLVRALAPFIAGSSRMPYRAMAPYSVLGTGIWATTFTLLGYFASKNIEAVLENSERAILGFGLLVGLIVGGIVLVRYLKQEENRRHVAAEMEKRPVLRNLLAFGRRVSPQARFLGPAGDARRTRARVHDRDGGARRRLLHLDRLRDPVQRRPRADARRHRGGRHRRGAAGGLAHRSGGGGDGAGLDSGGPGGHRCDGSLARVPAQLARADDPAGRRRRDRRRHRPASRRSSSAPGPRAGWSRSRTSPTRAAMRPIR